MYFTQTMPPEDAETRYSAIIADIGRMGTKLDALSKFLKEERAKIEESESVLRSLRNEKTQLEPVVTAHRETVEAILAAHARTTASRAWKERALGFMSGILTSLLATLLFELFLR